MRKKVSWMRILQDADEAMSRDDLTEYEVPVEVVNEAGIDGGYPTMRSMDEVAERFNLLVDFGYSWRDGSEPPPVKPMCKLRRR